MEPEQRLQAGIQALEGGSGKPKEANHQVARTAGRDCYFIGLGWAPTTMQYLIIPHLIRV